MTDPRTQLSIARQVEQGRVIERPGGVAGQTTFYASGTWTPTFVGTTIAGTFTYLASGQIGLYTRIGNQVCIHCYVEISAIAVAPTGNMQINGLPFAAANAAVDFSLAIGYSDNVNVSATAIQLMAFVRLNTATIWLSELFDNAAWARYPAANFTNASAGLGISGMYQV